MGAHSFHNKRKVAQQLPRHFIIKPTPDVVYRDVKIEVKHNVHQSPVN